MAYSNTSYIIQLLENEKLPDWWEKENNTYKARINAILVIDLRDLDSNQR